MKKYFQIFSFLIFHFPFLICLGQSVTIKGKADTSYLAGVNKIYAFTYDDLISYKEKGLASSTIDVKGNFNLSFLVSETTYIYLMIDNAKAEMVVEPDKTYDIHFLAKDSDAVNTLSIAVPVEIEFNNSEPAELNYLMADFSNRYEAFLEYNRPLITKKSSSVFGKIDTMKTLCKEKYSAFNKPYLNNYIDYTFAKLKESITLKDNENIFKDCIQNKSIQLHNYDYMNFFDGFFSQIVNQLTMTDNPQDELANKSFSYLMQYGKLHYKFLANDTIEEVVILKSLLKSASNPKIKVNYILSILEQAAKECKAKENRRSAENLKKKLSSMNIGKPAPALTFQDKDGKNVALADFKGKYIYLNFWTTWCATCTQEMMLIPELKKMYGNKITFISISVDKKSEEMKNFLKKNPKLDWIFLYCDDYKKAKEEFKVLTVPVYYLIDPKGNVLKSPAENLQDIEPTFIQIKKKK